jgi:hypothetical protein
MKGTEEKRGKRTRKKRIKARVGWKQSSFAAVQSD